MNKSDIFVIGIIIFIVIFGVITILQEKQKQLDNEKEYIKNLKEVYLWHILSKNGLSPSDKINENCYSKTIITENYNQTVSVGNGC